MAKLLVKISEFDGEVSDNLRKAAKWINSHRATIRNNYCDHFESSDYWGLPKNKSNLDNNEVNFITEQTYDFGEELIKNAKEKGENLAKEINSFVNEYSHHFFDFDVKIEVLGVSSVLTIEISLDCFELGYDRFDYYLSCSSYNGSGDDDTETAICGYIYGIIDNIAECDTFRNRLMSCEDFANFVSKIKTFEKRIEKLEEEEFKYFRNFLIK